MSQILESKNISSVLDYVDKNTLVIFDIDNTLIESSHHVGNVAWLAHIMDKLVKKGLNRKEAIGKQYQLWRDLQKSISVKLVDPDSISVLNNLHDSDIKTIGLTGRGADISDRTEEQLKSVGISLSRKTIHDQEVELDKLARFMKGVLSLEFDGHKGKRLVDLFSRLKFVPKRVLFVDDKRHHLEDVKDVLIKSGIPFKGIRYGGADEQEQSFNPDKARDELLRFFEDRKDSELIKCVI